MIDGRKVYVTFTDYVQCSPDYDMEKRPRVHEVAAGETIEDVVKWYRKASRYPENATQPMVFTVTVEAP